MRIYLTSAVAAVALAIGCAGRVVLPAAPPSAEQMAELWIDPGPEPRDLEYGVGGRRRAPARDAQYTFVGKDETGFSVSYDVTGPDGVEWSAKIGPEAQVEVVVSRVLWGLGYHQPPVYYLPSWTLKEENGELRKESEARFRPKLEQLDRLDEPWAWEENPFVGTRPFNGLLVVLLMLNSTDLKADNNSIYELKSPWPSPGADASRRVRRWFVVRDLGAALGETGKLYPRRNWIEGFERERFITGVKDGRIEFAYSGRHQHLLNMITPADLQWAATRMRRLSEDQWRDAFRTANYSEAMTDRYLRRINEKIDQALEVAARAGTTPDV